MNVVWHGTNRIVFVTKRWAFKVPNVRSYRMLLHGLLANDQEVTFSRTGWPELCPVHFSMPLGLLVVMPRAEPINDARFDDIDFVLAWTDRGEYVLPADAKQENFGLLDGKPVVIDYGSSDKYIEFFIETR